MKIDFHFWIRICLFNLLIVALLGVLMRYKIVFPFPMLLQKNVQHAHSHFAFAGWVSQLLFTLMILFMTKFTTASARKYFIILLLNLVCAYGMLVTFTLQGYGAYSITFATLSIFIAFYFAFVYYHDLRETGNHPARNWFAAALFFNVLSSLGTFALAYMMATKNAPMNEYLASVYFYLHFQYNGWFFFACMGLFYEQLHKLLPERNINTSVFWLFFFTCLPAYFLSTLWMKLPVWLYVILVITAILQVAAWGIFLNQLKIFYPILKEKFSRTAQYLLLLIAVSLTIKLLLQLFSTIPAISNLAFAFRPIVIAYLHLILLAIISLFLLYYIHAEKLVAYSKLYLTGLTIFVSGIFLNEIVLTVQGIASFDYRLIPYSNESLFGISVLMFAGILMMVVSQFQKREDSFT